MSNEKRLTTNLTNQHEQKSKIRRGGGRGTDTLLFVMFVWFVVKFLFRKF